MDGPRTGGLEASWCNDRQKPRCDPDLRKGPVRSGGLRYEQERGSGTVDWGTGHARSGNPRISKTVRGTLVGSVHAACRWKKAVFAADRAVRGRGRGIAEHS